MAQRRPNILFITADDMGGDTPATFGGPPGVTPTIDALAAEGMAFLRAHVPAAVCQPSRSAMMTGRWPHRNGAEGFEPVRDDVTVLTELLTGVDYRTGILGKADHLAPIEKFGWDFVAGIEDLGMGRSPQSYSDYVRRFITDAANADQPWFLMTNAHDPHRPFHGSDQEISHFTDEQRRGIPSPSKVFTAGQADPPGFLPDLPEVRREYAEYLGSSRRCDDVVAATLRALDDAGQAENTLVVFLSDNGMAFPFAKANCYLQSSRTPLIVRWPGVTQAGAIDDTHFVSGLDLFPTFCAAAGIVPADDIDGRTLIGLLGGAAEPDRDRVFTVFHETSGKRRFEMRCVQDATYGYIWNAWSDGSTTYKAENMNGRTWPAMSAAAEDEASAAARVNFYLHRQPEELYDLTSDPNGLQNLADLPEYGDQLAAMRSHMSAWMSDVDDPLAGDFAAAIGGRRG